MNLLVLATHYRNQPEVLQFAEQLFAQATQAQVSCRLLVADNSNDWVDRTILPPGMTVIGTGGKNLGYLNGCHFALESGAARTQVDWVAVANTDISFAPAFFTTLAETHWPDNVGIVAPRITRDDGVEQNPHLSCRPTCARMRFYTVAYRRTWGLRLLERLEVLRPRRRACRERRQTGIYAPHGSLMLIRRSFFECGGHLDYPAFMYGEAIHLAEQARRAGLRVQFAPDLRAWHHAGAVTSRQALSQRCAWKLQSACYLYETYFSEQAPSKPLLTRTI